jgi:predicted short-subunit dehydrogenase-like oxidoreductase (DUF2520 family)
MNQPVDVCKEPVMTHFYGSQAQPKLVFGEDKVKQFNKIVQQVLPGAEETKNAIQSCWREDVLENQWTLPDGHVAKVKNMGAVDKTIEIDELDHATFKHRIYQNVKQEFGLSLPANVVHSFDGYVVRQMIRMAESQGFYLLSIHDCFFCSPNHVQKMRENYVKILADIADNNYLQSVLREITGNPRLGVEKYSTVLGKEIMQADYAIC